MSTKILETKDGMRIKALGVTDKYVKTEILKPLADRSVNMPIIYRHIHPSSPAKGQILGLVEKATVVDVDDKTKGIEIEARMLEYTDYQKKAVEYISTKEKLNDPIKISVGFQQYGNEEKILDAIPFEWSLTSIPVCEECATEVITMEEKEIKQSVRDQKKTRTLTTLLILGASVGLVVGLTVALVSSFRNPVPEPPDGQDWCEYLESIEACSDGSPD